MAQSETAIIERLAVAVVSVARETRGVWLFAGWDAAGRPHGSDRLANLSSEAQEELALYRSSGLPPRRVPYTSLTAVEYVLTGPAIDFTDAGAQRAEDQVRYAVLDAAGERHDVALGEMAVLGAIADARTPWQVAGRTSATAVADSAVSLYTVLVPAPGQRLDRGLAILFRPTLPTSGNEAAFASFVRGTISRLLILDESQPPQRRKGYLEVAGRLAGTPPTGSLATALQLLRRLGLVSFSDEWYRQLRRQQQRSKGALARMLRAMGLVDVSDETLAELANPRPDYDVDPLELDELLAMAAEMYAVLTPSLGQSVSSPTRRTP